MSFRSDANNPSRVVAFPKLAKLLEDDPESEPDFHSLTREEMGIVLRALRNHMDACQNVAADLKRLRHEQASRTFWGEYDTARDLLEKFNYAADVQIWREER
jgi:hypothetical protein